MSSVLTFYLCGCSFRERQGLPHHKRQQQHLLYPRLPREIGSAMSSKEKVARHRGKQTAVKNGITSEAVVASLLGKDDLNEHQAGVLTHALDHAEKQRVRNDLMKSNEIAWASHEGSSKAAWASHDRTQQLIAGGGVNNTDKENRAPVAKKNNRRPKQGKGTLGGRGQKRVTSTKAGLQFPKRKTAAKGAVKQAPIVLPMEQNPKKMAGVGEL